MSDHMLLIGAEQVASAGHRMQDAAERMGQASAHIQIALDAHQRFLDDWLVRYEAVVTAARNGEPTR